MDINELFAKYPETKVTFINKLNNVLWPEWKRWCDCGDEEKLQVNLRQVFPNEIILDVEDPSQLDEIKNKLRERNYKYYLYSTGSRGFHVSLYFNNLDNLILPERNLLRRVIIKHFGCDETKSNETTLIAMENKPHFKTTKPKVLCEENSGTNMINESEIKRIKKLIQKTEEISSTLNLEKDSFFKDYSTKDPLLQFVLINTLEDGKMRDWVLLKNIAVGLVKQGLTNDEIRVIGDKIILNMPGKTTNELMGWVSKVRNNIIKDYNVGEINKWCQTFNYPLLYNEIEGIESMVKLLSMKQLWDLYWSENVIAQDIWRDLLFYCLIGIVLDERDEDFRIHTTFSSYTTTGKDTGVNLLISILENDKIKLKACKPTEITDKYLIGGINQYNREFNMKHGLKGSGDIAIVKGNQIEWQQEKIFGAFHEFNLIAFTEAEVVFKPSTFTQKIQLNLRRVMDKERKPFKGVGTDEITYFCNPTIIMTSFPVPKVIDVLLTNGLFQRTFFLHNQITQEQDELISAFLIRKMFDFSSREKTNIYKEELINRLVELKEWWGKNRVDWIPKLREATPRLDKYIEEKVSKIKKSYNYLDDEDKMKFDAILRRGYTNIEKVAILDALVNDKKITKERVDIAINLFEICLESVKELVWGTKISTYMDDRLDKVESAIINFINVNNGKVSTPQLNNFLENNLKIKSSRTQLKWKNRAIQRGLLRKIREGKEIYMVVIEEKEEEIDF